MTAVARGHHVRHRLRTISGRCGRRSANRDHSGRDRQRGEHRGDEGDQGSSARAWRARLAIRRCIDAPPLFRCFVEPARWTGLRRARSFRSAGSRPSHCAAATTVSISALAWAVRDFAPCSVIACPWNADPLSNAFHLGRQRVPLRGPGEELVLEGVVRAVVELDPLAAGPGPQIIQVAMLNSPNRRVQLRLRPRLSEVSATSDQWAWTAAGIAQGLHDLGHDATVEDVVVGQAEERQRRRRTSVWSDPDVADLPVRLDARADAADPGGGDLVLDVAVVPGEALGVRAGIERARAPASRSSRAPRRRRRTSPDPRTA